MTNAIIDVLEACQGGQLIDTLAAACQISESECRQSLERLVPEISRLIGERITDEDDLEDLVDILDEEEQVRYLDDPQAMLSRGAIKDGEDLLEILYGSLDQAHDVAEDIGPPRGVDEDVFERLMTMAAALTFSAMARRNQTYQMAAMSEPDDAASEQGIIAMFFSALMEGIRQGMDQAYRRKRTRRRKRSLLERILGLEAPKRTYKRRKKSRSRKRKTPSITDLIGDIFD